MQKIDTEMRDALNALAASMGRDRFAKWLKKNHSTLFPYASRDRLAERAELAQRIADCAVNGRIKLATAGRDCDGVQYMGTHRSDFPASVIAFEAEYDKEAHWADGPFSIWPEAPDAEVPSWQRDTFAEAAGY